MEKYCNVFVIYKGKKEFIVWDDSFVKGFFSNDWGFVVGCFLDLIRENLSGVSSYWSDWYLVFDYGWDGLCCICYCFYGCYEELFW